MTSSRQSPYWMWLQESQPIDGDLKWCHSTDAYSLRSMMRDGFISTQHCPIFRERLSYFFYGRPAYRKREFDQIRLSANAPVVLIFESSIESKGTRVFPFDSGAFEDRYSRWRHKQMDVGSFECPCGASAPKRHIAEFYGSKSRYLRMEASRPSRDYSGEFEVEAVAELLADPSSEAADDRRLAIELQLNIDLPLAAPHLSAMVVPKRLPEAQWFKDWKNTLGKSVNVRDYDLSPLRLAAHYQVAIEKLSFDLV